MLDLPEPLNLVKNWLLSSGLVITNKKDANYGAVHSFYDKEKNSFSFLYPEITGYFISTLRFLNSIEKNEDYLNLAKASADWLVNIFDKYGGIVMGIENNKPTQTLAFSFDTGICANALMDIHRLTGEQKYLEHSKRLLGWLDEAIEEDGSTKPYKDLSTNSFTESDEVWYKKKGCLNVKITIPFLRMYLLTNNQKFLATGKKICNSYRSYQNDNGSFSMHSGESIVNLHTQCYALEGLLVAYGVTRNDEYLDSCRKSLEWCIQKIDDDGSIPLWFNSKYKVIASYPLAQLIRIMAIFDNFTSEFTFKKYATKIKSFLLELQELDSDSRSNGGFYEELSKSIFRWKMRKRINSWGSMFTIQALAWFDSYENLNSDSIKYLY